jgi:hypothetical protein
MKIIDEPPECPKCHGHSLFSCLAHRPPPDNPSWVVHIFCMNKQCRWSIVIGVQEITDKQVQEFKTEENQKNLVIVNKALEHKSPAEWLSIALNEGDGSYKP